MKSSKWLCQNGVAMTGDRYAAIKNNEVTELLMVERQQAAALPMLVRGGSGDQVQAHAGRGVLGYDSNNGNHVDRKKNKNNKSKHANRYGKWQYLYIMLIAYVFMQISCIYDL